MGLPNLSNVQVPPQSVHNGSTRLNSTSRKVRHSAKSCRAVSWRIRSFARILFCKAVGKKEDENVIEMVSHEADEKVRRAYEPLKDSDGLV